jgi:hypothetical protein
VLRADAGAPSLSEGAPTMSVMPGGVKVGLRAGEAVIYSGLLLHRGCTTASAERLCVACNWNTVGGNDMPSLLDARLSHQMRPEVRAVLPMEWMQKAWDRWMDTVVDDGLANTASLNRAAGQKRPQKSDDLPM